MTPLTILRDVKKLTVDIDCGLLGLEIALILPNCHICKLLE